MKSKHWIKIILGKICTLVFCPRDPNKDNNKWPAIILAVNRIAKVRGRIISLIDSITTMKGINKIGVPWGVKCESKSLKKLKILNIIILIHILSAKDRQYLICLEAVKI